MDEAIPLYLHNAQERHLAALKAEKQALGLDVLLRPVEARPGQFGRVLAFGEHPGWIVDSVLVSHPSLARDALLWAIGRKELPFDGAASKLSRWMGAEVREVT